jgi:hypothetical protein
VDFGAPLRKRDDKHSMGPKQEGANRSAGASPAYPGLNNGIAIRPGLPINDSEAAATRV